MYACLAMRLSCCLVIACLSAPAFAAMTCVTPDQTASMLNKDVCVAAHVYNVVQLKSGTRFLDTCSPLTPDSACHFTVISLPEDRKDVGPLDALNGQNIQIRGKVRSFPDHREIVLSHSRQLRGGKEKFRPNPALMKKFSAQEHSMAFRDPNARSATRSTGLRSR
ncbi:MAG: hypothetical protein ACYCSN_03175 [Acidobacteriaceae bacterium]